MSHGRICGDWDGLRDERKTGNRADRMPKNFAIIIGAMKSGTTSLFDLLCQHPEVAGCRTKEPDFFASHADPSASWDGYTSLWNWMPGEHRIALEASVSYAKAPWVPDVPGRIHSVTDVGFRFIYMMRHPLRRIESQVRHGVYDGWGQSLDEGIAEDLLDFSRYAMQLDQYMEFFPRESILALTLDEFQATPSDVLRRCCEFLEISEGFEFQRVFERRNTGDFYSVHPVVADLARSRWLGSAARTVLPRRAHHWIREFFARRLGGQKTLGRWRLNEEEEDLILQKLSSDLRRLVRHYGVDAQGLWSVPEDYVRE